ncbi:MAG: hypothetical protein N2C14_20690, partial [Planctomycetales bacterium]
MVSEENRQGKSLRGELDRQRNSPTDSADEQSSRRSDESGGAGCWEYQVEVAGGQTLIGISLAAFDKRRGRLFLADVLDS